MAHTQLRLRSLIFSFYACIPFSLRWSTLCNLVHFYPKFAAALIECACYPLLPIHTAQRTLTYVCITSLLLPNWLGSLLGFNPEVEWSPNAQVPLLYYPHCWQIFLTIKRLVRLSNLSFLGLPYQNHVLHFIVYENDDVVRTISCLVRLSKVKGVVPDIYTFRIAQLEKFDLGHYGYCARPSRCFKCPRRSINK